MNKKALILLALLLIPAYTFLQPTPNKNIHQFSNNLSINQTGNNGIITQSINMGQTIQTTGYTAPYVVNILWDNHLQTYYYSYRYDEIRADLEKIYGVNITINNDLFNNTDLSKYDIIVIPGGTKNMTNEEITAIKTYLQNNGTLLIMGDRSSYYPPYLNATTSSFGLAWYNATIYDDTNYQYRNYYPFVHVWTNTTVAKYITEGYSNLEVKSGGCPILIIGDNTTTKIYIVATGDNDTYTDAGPANGTAINFFVAVDIPNGGRIFASSGSNFLQDSYNYGDYGNATLIGPRIFGWLMAEGLEITNVSVPNDLEINSEGDITFTVKNNLDNTANNVKVSIEYTGGIEVLNSTQEVNIGNLTAGETKILKWHIRAINQSTVRVVLKVWSDNAKGFSKAEEFNTKGVLLLEAYTSKKYVKNPANVTLYVNITNPVSSNTNTTINVTITLPLGIKALSQANYTNVTLNSGESFIFNVNLTTTENITSGAQEIAIYVSSADLGAFADTVTFYAFLRDVAIFYQHDVYYYQYFRFESFLNNVSTYLDVFAMNDIINNEILSFTKLVILPEPDHPMETSELNLFKNYLDNGGYMIILGDWYNYFDPNTLNPLTSGYGIIWNDGEIMDDVNNYNNRSYAPILSTHAINPYGGYIMRNVESVIFHGSTYLTLNSSNAYPVLLGNPTSYAVDSNGNPVGINGTDIVAMAVAETANGGLIVASGSTYAFRSDGSYSSYYAHNKQFLLNILGLFFAGDFVFDTEAPTITLSSTLQNYSCVEQQFTLTWSASDNVEVSAINIYVNDELYDTLPSTATAYNFDLTDGVYTIKVEAVDWVGYTDSASIILIVDSVPPTLTITNPTDGSTIASTSVTIEWAIDDPAVPLVGHYEIYLDGVLVNDSIPGDATSYVLTGLTEGTHNITIVVSSCLTTATASIEITVDISGPTINYAPENGSEVTVPFDISANFSDPSGLERYEILIDGSVVSSGSLSGTTATVSYTVEDLSDGTHTITIRVYDSLGNVSEETFVVTVTAPTGGIDPLVISGVAIAIIILLGILFYLYRGRQ